MQFVENLFKEDKDLCEVCAEWHGVGVLVIEYT